MTKIPYPFPTNEGVTYRMQRNPKYNTGLEKGVRSAVHRQGLRFRVHWPIRIHDSTVRPDLVFPGQRLAVFVDGCFWHACPDHGTKPVRNVEYWTDKIQRNQNRDASVDRGLRDAGWRVLRIWEHVPSSQAATLVSAALKMGRTDIQSTLL
jgi:DNA mismatch endonuclease (patch repair protein)